MKNILQLAKESGRTLLEIFAQVPGSFEEYRQQIRTALSENPPAELQGANYCYIEGCVGDFPEKVILESVTYDEDSGKSVRKYHEAKVMLDENNSVVFSDVKEVEIKAAITAKNEMVQLSESNKSDNIKMTDFVETYEATVTLEPQTEAMKTRNAKRKARVSIAQKADAKNENGRVYPKEVLQEAVEAAQAQINEFGGLLMDSEHRTDGNGANVTKLRETVALIKQIEFNEETNTVSLPEIEFVETQAGKDLMALLESGVKLQVSQRGHGTSHPVVDPSTNETYQKVDFLRIVGFDTVPGGTASVKEAHLESTNEEQQKSQPLKTLTGRSEQTNGNGAPTASKNGGGEERSLEEQTGTIVPVTTELSTEDRELVNSLTEKSQTQQSELEQSKALLEEATRKTEEANRKTEIAHLKQAGKMFLEAEIANLPRFNEEQKQMVIDAIDPESFYSQITDVYSEEAIAHVLKPVIAKEVAKIDKIIATTQLEGMNFPVEMTSGVANQQQGQTRVTVLHENMPGAEMRQQILEEVNAQIKKESERDLWIMSDNHPCMAALDEVMRWFWQDNYHAVKNENTLAQSDIGGRIASIAAMVIPTAWRMTTAFQVIDLEPMPNRILDKKIRIQDQGNTTDLDVVTQYANLDPGENGNISEVNASYLNYPIYATRQALRSKITSEARATARNTPMQPMIDTIVDISLDIRNRIDMMLWWLIIVQGLHQDTGQVTDWETLTRSGTTKTWTSKNKAWIPLTWHKTKDDNGNPTSARFEQLYPASGKSAAPTGFGTQGIELQTDNSTAVALLYGTDYTIDFQSGQITLTAAGETKRSTDNIQAKYTYSKNVSTWSMTPASGTTLAAHLLNLRRAVGQRRVAVSNRNWIPNTIGLNYDIEDLITHSDRMTFLGGTPAELLDQMNQVVRYGGLDPVKSSALPTGWIPVFKKGAACHGVHTPWMFEPPITNENTGVKYVLGEQYSGSDVPVNDMIGVVAVLP